MNYATLNGKNQWGGAPPPRSKVLKTASTDAMPNWKTNRDIRYKLADIPCPTVSCG